MSKPAGVVVAGDGALAEGEADDPIVTRWVPVRSRLGKLFTEANEPITRHNVADYAPHPDDLAQVEAHIATLGFEVVDRCGPALVVRGRASELDRLAAVPVASPRSDGALAGAAAAAAPDDLQRLVGGLHLHQKVFHHGVSAKPPPVSYLHVDVPAGLRAALAQSSGGPSGTGVAVTQVDLGCDLSHPWFSANHVKLAGSWAQTSGEDPLQDPLGHGTAMAANLLSVAPACSLTIGRMSSDSQTGEGTDPVGALTRAAKDRPAVLACSWGDNIPSKLDSNHRYLEYTVAKLASQGIIMVFSAGNRPRDGAAEGEFGFPAQHPDVIAAGGAFIQSNQSLSASDYASGFESRLYKDRIVPDVCGLVGPGPYGVYIMLPTEPGSAMDQMAASGQPYPQGDQTGKKDGWSCVSGTSSAAAQLAGVCALLLEVAPALDLDAVRRVLQRSACDVANGTSNPRAVYPAGSNQARPGPDTATGYGLVDVDAAVSLARALVQHPRLQRESSVSWVDRVVGVLEAA